MRSAVPYRRDAAPSTRCDPARLATLRATGLLGAALGPDERAELDDLAGLAAELSGAPLALLTLVDDERQLVVGTHGLGARAATLREIPASHCLCVHVVEGGRPLVLGNAGRSAFAANGAVREWGVAAYAGVPVTSRDGHVLGVLSVVDQAARRWSPRLVERLTRVARLAGATLDRRLAESALESSVRLRDVLLDASPDCVKLLTPDGRLERMNAAGCRLLEVDDPDRLLGGDWAAAWPGDGARLARAAVVAARAGETARFSGVCPTLRGTPRWWDVTVAPVHDAAGAVTRLLVVSRDVTEARRAEARLRESEARLREAQRIGRIGSWHVDLPSGVLEWSAELARMYGFAPMSRTATLDDLLAVAHPDDRDTMRRHVAAEDAMSVAAGHQFRIRRPDGAVRVMRTNGEVTCDEQGTPVRLSGTVQDVTEQVEADLALRRSEARFRALTEHASEMISVLDAEGIIRYANAPFLALLGIEPEEAVGRSCFGFIHPDDQARIGAVLTSVLAHPWESVSCEYRARHVLHGWRVLCSIGTNLCDDPSIGGVVVNTRDVTEERALAAQLRQAQKMEAIGRLAGGVAHDFNNLLQVITAATVFARDSIPPGSEALHDLADIDDAARRAAALTAQLLAFSRRQLLRPELLDLSAVVADVARMLRRLMEDVTLATELPGDLAPVYADAGQLEQVLMNLAVNAREAMPDGGTLTLETANVRLDDPGSLGCPSLVPGDYVALRVRDTGVGMDEETMALIFEPFFTTRPPGKGTGLGLSTVYGIVTQSGGGLHVESAPGAGATFTVFLPRATAPDTVHVPDAPSAPSPQGSETILLVEDEAPVRATVRRMLERGGYRVVEAKHGSDALLLAEQHVGRINLVLTDVVMPEMGAALLLERLRARWPALRALLMSGYSEEAVGKHGVLVEGSELLSKPFTAEVLLRQVRATLDA